MSTTPEKYKLLSDRDLFAFLSESGRLYHLGLFHSFDLEGMESSLFDIVEEECGDADSFTEEQVKSMMERALEEIGAEGGFGADSLGDGTTHTDNDLLALLHGLDGYSLRLEKLKGLTTNLDRHVDDLMQRVE
ncbi:hypothetical protein RZS08_24770, partial [Arthrospira platensis SPKY1]|nr:hypothetical protein [Arthrospira platensis SPKY1]